MILTKISFERNLLNLYSRKKLVLSNENITSRLKNEDVKKLHAFLLKNIENGWYAEVLLNEKKFLLNDFIGSFRIYINIKTKVWSTNFWDLIDFDFNNDVVGEVIKRGYTTGFKTISDSINKLLPSSIFDFKSNSQSPNVKGLFDFPSSKKPLSNIFDYKQLKNKKIGIAFSGGLDSTFLASELVKLGLKPKLFYFKTEIDDEKDLSFDQSTLIAYKLKLDLITIEISNNELIEYFPKCFEDYPNDISYSILAIKCFAKKIENKIDLLITGQNSDTFLAFGLSRALHPIETLSRFIYKNQYKKLYENIPLNILDNLMLKLVYSLKRLDHSNIPVNRTQLISGWANEKFYLSQYNDSLRNYSGLEYFDNLSYYEAVITNKIINHLAGNHSLVWSDIKNMEILMPLGNLKFMHSCFNEFSKWYHTFKPKYSLEKSLIIKFKRKQHNIIDRLLNFISSKKHVHIDFNFENSYKESLNEMLKSKKNLL